MSKVTWLLKKAQIGEMRRWEPAWLLSGRRVDPSAPISSFVYILHSPTMRTVYITIARVQNELSSLFPHHYGALGSLGFALWRSLRRHQRRDLTEAERA